MNQFVSALEFREALEKQYLLLADILVQLEVEPVTQTQLLQGCLLPSLETLYHLLTSKAGRNPRLRDLYKAVLTDKYGIPFLQKDQINVRSLLDRHFAVLVRQLDVADVIDALKPSLGAPTFIQIKRIYVKDPQEAVRQLVPAIQANPKSFPIFLEQLQQHDYPDLLSLLQ